RRNPSKASRTSSLTVGVRRLRNTARESRGTRPLHGMDAFVGTIRPLSDRVVIRIPASTKHVALVRATATSLPAMLDFTYDRITDLHIAIDEICSRIMATSAPPVRRLEVTFTVESTELRIEARGDAPARGGE